MKNKLFATLNLEPGTQNPEQCSGNIIENDVKVNRNFNKIHAN